MTDILYVFLLYAKIIKQQKNMEGENYSHVESPKSNATQCTQCVRNGHILQELGSFAQ